MSDTETKNLLEDAIEDEEESDLEDSKTLSSDMGRAPKPIQVFGYRNFFILQAKKKEVKSMRKGLARSRWSLLTVL